MRITLLCVGSALAASLLLSACSSGGVTRALPGGSQSLTSGYSDAQLGGPEMEFAASCPKKYAECVTVSKSKPVKQEWCVEKKGTKHCKHLEPGTWTWSAPVTKTNGKKFTRIVTSFKPNPGNPTELTISEKSAVRSSKGKVKYEASLKACNTSSECGTALIGIITK